VVNILLFFGIQLADFSIEFCQGSKHDSTLKFSTKHGNLPTTILSISRYTNRSFNLNILSVSAPSPDLPGSWTSKKLLLMHLVFSYSQFIIYNLGLQIGILWS
jgi:hypothetical protein